MKLRKSEVNVTLLVFAECMKLYKSEVKITLLVFLPVLQLIAFVGFCCLRASRARLYILKKWLALLCPFYCDTVFGSLRFSDLIH